MEATDAASADLADCSLVSVDSEILKLRRASSRVWSDLRGAFKGIGKSKDYDNEEQAARLISVAGSHSSTAFECRPEDAQSVLVKRDHRIRDASPTNKEKAMTPAELVKRLRLDTWSITPNTTGFLGSAPSRHRRRRSSAQAPNNTHAAMGADAHTPLANTTAEQVPADTSASRKVSMESLTSNSSKDGLKRRKTRRFLRAKSNPETLTTIKESNQDTFTPTILTTEKAAAVKISMETYYNELLTMPNARLHRRHILEGQLFYHPQMSLAEKDAIRRAFFHQESCYLRQCRTLKGQSQKRRLCKNNAFSGQNFEPVQILGKGSFGVVRLVREKKTDPHMPSQVFAMKVIRKSEMLSSSQEGHLRAERDFLVAAEGSNWVVPLVASFQDFTNLYLVMEYMPGGDFLGMLMRENVLHETIARFYIAEMILGVEETHRLQFIHRDIKPDNFLISASGHLKISDFGLAFDGHWSHDAAFYSWHRHSLFQHCRLSTDDKYVKDDSGTGDSNRTKNLEPNEMTKGCKTAYGNLTRFNPRNSTRGRATAYSVVGTSQYMAPEHKDRCPPGPNGLTDVFGRHVFADDAEDIKDHRWFKHFPWDQVPNMTPPFVPNISSPEDTHYFEDSEAPDDWSESNQGTCLGPGEVHEILREFRQYVQQVAVRLVAQPHNSSSLRMIDSELENSPDLSEGEKLMLKRFIRMYGRRQRKRPRDVLLRDGKIRDAVMEVRKSSAFVGYSWRRMPPCGYMMTELQQ
ncbi:Protein kinase-like domain [Cordyceps militaris CM01]|uniref:non-specific serine/threonine protein kinase n=1 Tax=Cordyceps militaris (strain CM01) TaxID=983644 RepID=G3JK28_CORMM|nr:Protein kinase-like domain [Cordyceps militaris CM01]EGX92158.1 Protein kinase-like domain [Cordyceps militaris CM01]